MYISVVMDVEFHIGADEIQYSLKLTVLYSIENP